MTREIKFTWYKNRVFIQRRCEYERNGSESSRVSSFLKTKRLVRINTAPSSIKVKGAKRIYVEKRQNTPAECVFASFFDNQAEIDTTWLQNFHSYVEFAKYFIFRLRKLQHLQNFFFLEKRKIQFSGSLQKAPRKFLTRERLQIVIGYNYEVASTITKKNERKP